MKRLLQVIALLFCVMNVGAQEHDLAFTFVNFFSKSPDKIYLGAIMDINTLNKDTHPVLDISNRQKINVLQEGPIKNIQISPSKENMNNFILNDIKDEDFDSYVNTFDYSIDSYPSYERLGPIFGEKIDAEIMLGVTTKNTADNHSITIVKLSRLLNRLLFEVEDDKIQDHPAIAALNLNDLMYVQDIWFGRMATIVVESKSDSDSIKAILEKILNGQKLSEQESAIIANSTVHYSLFNDPKANFDSGDTFENVKQYMKAMPTKEDFLRPIYFSGQSLADGDMVGNVVK